MGRSRDGGGYRQDVVVPTAPSRRFFASWVDALVLILPVLAIVRPSPKRPRPPSAQRRWAVTALHAGYHIGSIALFGRTLGDLVARCEVVDETSGKKPSVRQAFLRWSVLVPPQLPTLLHPGPVPDFEALERRREEFSRLAEEHKGDPEAIVEALRELQKNRRAAGITPRLAPRLWREALRLCYECAVYGPILGPSRRGLHDRIAGTLVVSKSGSLGPP